MSRVPELKHEVQHARFDVRAALAGSPRCAGRAESRSKVIGA